MQQVRSVIKCLDFDIFWQMDGGFGFFSAQQNKEQNTSPYFI